MCFGSKGNRYRPQLWFEFVVLWCVYIWFGFMFRDEFIWLEFVFCDAFIWFGFVFRDEFIWLEFVFCDAFIWFENLSGWFESCNWTSLGCLRMLGKLGFI
jgi:hypothetical protein